MGQRKAKPEQIAAERKRQERAYQLKMAGLTFQQIADSAHPDNPAQTLYSDARSAQRAWQAARDRHTETEGDPTAKRQVWELRNETVFRAMWPQVIKGDHFAIDRYTKLLAEHLKMLPPEIRVITQADIDTAMASAQQALAQRNTA